MIVAKFLFGLQNMTGSHTLPFWVLLEWDTDSQECCKVVFDLGQFSRIL